MSTRANEFRQKAIELAKANGGYHFGGSFSTAELLCDLYDHIMTPSDKFILSKGHGCWVYYAILLEQGFSPKLEGHPHRDPANGVHCTTGSMGHGLPVGIGIAYAMKRRGKGERVFVMLGDGECQEGTTWESILIGARLRLGNIVAIVDNNKIQGSDFTAAVLPVIPAVVASAEAAGWEVVGDNLVFPDTSSVEALSIFAAELQERYDALTAAVAAAAPALSAGDPAPSGNLSIKQQARRDQEEREKRERLAAAAQKKKSSGPSLKQQARMAEEKKASADRAAEAEMKADLKRKLEADKLERADPNWSASVAGDKSMGKSLSTFREKFGEDKGGCC